MRRRPALTSRSTTGLWAASTRRKTLFQGPQTAHYAGSPQGRCPDESGVHGCTLVQVDHGRKVRTKFITTESVRWRTESLTLTEGANRNDLQRQLRSAMQRIASEAGGAYVLVSWEVQGCETLDPPAAERATWPAS